MHLYPRASPPGLRGLAQWIEGAASLLKLANQGSGGGAASPSGNAGGGYSASTQVSTQVNPQISPVMVQQTSPSNSPINASPQAFAVPQPNGTPVTGAIPGFDNASGYAPTGVPMATIRSNAGLTIAAAVAVAIGAAFLLRKKRA